MKAPDLPSSPEIAARYVALRAADAPPMGDLTSALNL
jgi:hypothetical protein